MSVGVGVMRKIEKEINADAREATARQTYKAVVSQERPDIAVAIILRSIDEWYEKGALHIKNDVRQSLDDLEKAVYDPNNSPLSVAHAINHVR